MQYAVVIRSNKSIRTGRKDVAWVGTIKQYMKQHHKYGTL